MARKKSSDKPKRTARETTFSYYSKTVISSLEKAIASGETRAPWQMGWFKPRNKQRSPHVIYNFMNQMILREKFEYEGYKTTMWVTGKAILKALADDGVSAEGVMAHTKGKYRVTVGWRPSKAKKEVELPDGSIELQPAYRFPWGYLVVNLDVLPAEVIASSKTLTKLYEQGKVEVPEFEHEQHELAERFIRLAVEGSGLTAKTGTHQPHYNAKTDTIDVTEASRFEQVGEYYQTTFHELMHAAGHKSRLDNANLSGSGPLEVIELAAEIGAQIIADVIGVSTEAVFDNSQAYLLSWHEAAKGNDQLIPTALEAAEKGFAYWEPFIEQARAELAAEQSAVEAVQQPKTQLREGGFATIAGFGDDADRVRVKVRTLNSRMSVVEFLDESLIWTGQEYVKGNTRRVHNQALIAELS